MLPILPPVLTNKKDELTTNGKSPAGAGVKQHQRQRQEQRCQRHGQGQGQNTRQVQGQELKQRRREKQVAFRMSQKARRASSSFDRQVNIKLRWVLDGMGAETMSSWLSRDSDLRNSMYILEEFDGGDVAKHLGINDVYWPVVILLAAHSRKCMFRPNLLCPWETCVTHYVTGQIL